MARQQSQSLRGGGIGSSEIGPVGAKVVARPVDTFVDPAESNFTRLSTALNGFLPGFSQYAQQEATEKKKRWEAEERARGAADAQMSEVATTEASISAYSSEASPIAQDAFRAQLGARAIREANEAFSQYASENFDPNNPDPNYAKTFAKDYFDKNVEGMQDPLFRASYADGMTKIIDQFSRNHIGQVIEQHERQKVANVTSAIDGYLKDDTGRPADWIDQLKAGNPYLPKAQVEMSAWSATVEHAVNTGRPEMLDDFTRDTADGQKGFVFRGGDAVYKQYLDAKARAQVKFLQGHKTNMQMQEENARTFLNEKLQNIGTFQEDFEASDLEGIYGTLDGLANAGVFGANYAEAIAGYKKQFYEKFTDILKLRPVAEKVLAGQGTYDLASLDPKDQQRVLKLAQKQNPGIDPRLIAVRNGVIADEDRRMFVNVANFVGNAEKGEMPPELMPAFETLQFYMGADGGSKAEVFWNNLNKDNPEAFHFWTNMQELLQHDPNKDIQTITQAAKVLTATRKDAVKYEGQTATEIVEKVTKKLANNDAGMFSWVPGLGAPQGEQSNSYMRTWVLKELEHQRRLVPNATEEALTTTVAAKFKNTHVLIGKSWVDTSTMPVKPTVEQTEQIAASLEAFKKVEFLRQSGDLRFNWATEDIDNYEVSLRPVPKVFNKNGEPLFHVAVNGILMSEPVNILQLERQHRNREAINPEAIQRVDEVMSRMDKGYANPSDYNTALADHDRVVLTLARDVGLLTDKQFQQYDKLVGAHQKRAKGEEFVMAEKERFSVAKSSPLLSKMMDAPDPEILSKALPPNDLLDPKMGNIHQYTREQAKGSNPQFALAALVYGNSGMLYEQEGEQRIGFGFKFDPKDNKGLREAFSKANISGNIGFDVMAHGIASRKGRITRPQAEKLYSHQLAAAQKQLTAVMGEGEFSVATPGMQYGLSTLVTTFGDSMSIPVALDAIKAGDFKSIAPLMTRVPAKNRESALAYIRAMMHGTANFRALVEQRTPDR